MRKLKSISRILRVPFLVVFFILIIIHFVIKDRFHLLSVFFYACPLPLIILFGFCIIVMFYKQKIVCYTLGTILLTMSLYFSLHYFGSAAKIDAAPTRHLLLWNVAQNKPLPTDILIKHIQESHAEIVALVEAQHVSKEDKEILRNALPDYQFRTLYGTMLIGVKGTIDEIVFQDASDVYKFNYLTTTINQKQVRILLADIYAGPLLNKEIPLGIIRDFTKKHKVDVLLGDFNTPYESVFFKDFKSDFKSFHAYSSGMTATWPVPIPVMEIDQIWLDNALQPIELQKFCYGVSDHKLLIAEFR